LVNGKRCLVIKTDIMENRNLPEYLIDGRDSFHLIETKFPHIAKRLINYETINECRAYLENLLESANPSTLNQGFSPEIITAIYSILSKIQTVSRVTTPSPKGRSF
jgi:hypothetical protein